MKNPTNSSRLNWIIGLILIITIYTLFYVYFSENQAIKLVPRKFRHIIKFATTSSVYFIGTYYLGTISVKWMQQLWHIIHISLLGILICFGLFDWIINPVPKSVREISMVLQEFLISPVLYIAMSIINKQLR